MQLPVEDAVGSGNRCSQENLANLAFAPKQRSNALGEWQTPKGVYGHWEKPTTTNEQVLLGIILNTLNKSICKYQPFANKYKVFYK